MKIRPMKVADAFYPGDPVVLKQMLDYFFSNIKPFKVENIKAAVTPHAGYVYSGPIAAYTYEAMRQNLDYIPKTIFVLSPDHYIGMNKVLVWNYDELETPFGNLKMELSASKKEIDNLIDNILLDSSYKDYEDTQPSL